MKNADMPAMPLSGDAYRDFANYDETSGTSYNPECQGMTKREMFAMHAMQALASGGSENWLVNHAPAIAVKIADATLAELEKTK